MDINKVHSEAGFWDGDKGGDSDMENTDLLENHGNMVSPSEDTESQTEVSGVFHRRILMIY